jgi:hypothetical protein
MKGDERSDAEKTGKQSLLQRGHEGKRKKRLQA